MHSTTFRRINKPVPHKISNKTFYVALCTFSRLSSYLPSALGGGGLGGSFCLEYDPMLFLASSWLKFASESGPLDRPRGARLFLSSGNEFGPVLFTPSTFCCCCSSKPLELFRLLLRVGGCTYKFWFE